MKFKETLIVFVPKAGLPLFLLVSVSLQRLHIENCTWEKAHPKGCWDILRGFRWGPGGMAPF